MRKVNSNAWIMLLVLLCGIVLGGFIGRSLEQVKYFSWLSYGKTFGISTSNPFVLDLSVLKVSFGCLFHINIASILGMVIAFIAYKIVRR